MGLLSWLNPLNERSWYGDLSCGLYGHIWTPYRRGRFIILHCHECGRTWVRRR